MLGYSANRHHLVVAGNLLLDHRVSREEAVFVVAPIGSAILGYRTGDTVQVRIPGGLRRLHSEQVLYQPEAAGQVHA